MSPSEVGEVGEVRSRQMKPYRQPEFEMPFQK